VPPPRTPQCLPGPRLSQFEQGNAKASPRHPPTVQQRTLARLQACQRSACFGAVAQLRHHASQLKTPQSSKLNHIDHHRLIGLARCNKGDNTIFTRARVLADTDSAINGNTHAPIMKRACDNYIGTATAGPGFAPSGSPARCVPTPSATRNTTTLGRVLSEAKNLRRDEA